MRLRLAVPRIVAVLALIVALAGAMDLLAASTAGRPRTTTRRSPASAAATDSIRR